MKTAKRIIGHDTLVLGDIAPSNSPKFSPNLHKYLKSRGVFFTEGGLSDAVFVVQPNTSATRWFEPGTLLLGHFDAEYGMFMGTRLLSALSNGASADRAAYPCGAGLEVIADFWDKYLKYGRCAVDPEHQEHFLSDRFRVNAEGRECLWCGAQQRKVVTERTVEDTTWVTQ